MHIRQGRFSISLAAAVSVVLGLFITSATQTAADVTSDDGLFPLYQSLCISSLADQKAAIDLTDKLGWMPIPDRLISSFNNSTINIDNIVGRMRSDKAKIEFFVVGTGTVRQGGESLPAKFCAIAAQPGFPQDGAALETWAAVPGHLDGATTYYSFLDEPSGHVTAATSGQALLDAAHSGQLRMAGASPASNSQMSFLIFVVPLGGSN